MAPGMVAYFDVVAYDRDFVVPEPPKHRRGALVGAAIIGFLLGAIGPHPKLPAAAPSPSPTPVASSEAQQLQMVEDAREAAKLTPWQRAEKAGRANKVPFWNPKHRE